MNQLQLERIIDIGNLVLAVEIGIAIMVAFLFLIVLLFWLSLNELIKNENN